MYDLIILGGGPAGYNAAERAAHGGLKTLVIEERALGGVCLNEGCIPTKTLLYSAKIYDYAKHSADYGVTFGSASIDHNFVVERKNKVVKQLVGGIGAKLKKAGVEVVSATAAIKERNAEGFVVTAADKEYVGKQLLICTGSSAAIPPIDGLKDSLASGFALTNREVLDLKEIPKTIVVVGGGVIGLEMASYFNSVGSKVYVLEMLDHIAGATDGEISKMLQKEYASRGVEFILGAKVTSIKDKAVSYEKDGKVSKLDADYALVSIGRRPRTQGIGCENIGLKLERGAIVTNEYGKTNVPGVWAAGDVNGKSMLAHTAYREGEVCINNILGKKDRINYNSIPSVIYTNPEVASVGETAESCKAKGLDVKIDTVTLKYSGRYVAENEHGNGVVKIITDKAHNNIIGVHMYGTYASEIIYGAAMMVETEMRVTDVQKLVFPHPTVCEVIREAMFM
ncbi:MAG: dihydrolipoyl dehydrogenase [Clostridia bacterium]|nr:dihydrolipoyl dehydrogenase [Clostridia bacterium]MBO5102247.1 dihydrolipoyl dehydrogenase [Clostridia bacterium]MBO5316499.1 dihydrolipoyl dehydrogenase [Clostridia bacterium]